MFASFLMFHLQWIDILSNRSLTEFWITYRHEALASKICFGLGLLACGLIVLDPYIGIITSVLLFMAHGLLAIRK